MTLPLPANRSEVDASGDVDRRVVFDDPCVDGTKTELGESKRQHARGRAAGIASAGVRPIAEHDPDVGRLEMRIEVAEAHNTDRGIVAVGREDPQNIAATLHRNLEPLRADELAPVTEVQPLIVLFLGQPSDDEPKEIRCVNRLELHGS